jgi:hypothetical protein
MTASVLQAWKNTTPRCSICGWSITLELSKTDEAGKAVHECCYVQRITSQRTESMGRLPQIDSVRTGSEPVLAGMHWRIFGLLRV